MNITTQSYDATAREYAERTRDFHPREAAEKFLSRIPKESKILDLGCGPGRDARIFSDMGYDVTGLDKSKEMINLAKQISPRSQFFIGDAVHMVNFGHEKFDGIWACASLIHLDDAELFDALNEAYRVLVDEGIFYLDFKQGSGQEIVKDSRYNGAQKFVNYHQTFEIENMLKETGFVDVESWGKEKDNPYATNNWLEFLAKK